MEQTGLYFFINYVNINFCSNFTGYNDGRHIRRSVSFIMWLVGNVDVWDQKCFNYEDTHEAVATGYGYGTWTEEGQSLDGRGQG